jgi:hypothetical protein
MNRETDEQSNDWANYQTDKLSNYFKLLQTFKLKTHANQPKYSHCR